MQQTGWQAKTKVECCSNSV